MVILALDPGESTGYCIFNWPHTRQVKPRENLESYLVAAGQIASRDIVVQNEELDKLICKFRPERVIYEKFMLYGHKAASQIGSDMFTPQVIGQIQVVAAEHGTPVISNSAQNVKLFYTDKKIKEHGLWQPGLKHARDAIRHALYAIDFNLFKPKLRRKKNYEL